MTDLPGRVLSPGDEVYNALRDDRADEIGKDAAWAEMLLTIVNEWLPRSRWYDKELWMALHA